MILQRLSAGKRGTHGEAPAVAEEVLADPSLLGVILAGALDADPLLRARCAHVLLHCAREQPDLLLPYTQDILDGLTDIAQWEVQSAVLQMTSVLSWTPPERQQLAAYAKRCLNERSSIVRTNAMQALVDLALHDDDLRQDIGPLIRRLAETGTAAMRARGRKLTAQLNLL